MKATLPELSLVVLIGPSGAGKSTFARKHFKATEVLSSDFCRGLVTDDENSQAATNDAFEVLHFIGAKRLAAGKLTVVDATNVQPEARKPLVALARQYHCLPVAIVFDLPEKICHERNKELLRKLRGKDVQITHGLAESLAQLEREPEEFRKDVMEFIDRLVSHYVLDDGKLVVAHAGMKESMQGRGSGKVRDFALYGETTGETDEFGLPVRYNWASEYRGRAMVVYGHTPVPEPEWLNGTINIDTGCVFGGRLTALRYPEKEFVSVPAERMWCEPAKPFLEQSSHAPALTAQQEHDDVLDMEDVLGKRIVTTRLHHTVTVREENAIAALEVMSRFAANPKWLIYLPPTMSPSDTAPSGGMLEHPAQAFAYYRHEGIPKVICEEKHMGSRAVVVVCRDATVARKRFGVVEDEDGVVYTRTGRRFFDTPALERELLSRIRSAADQAGLWDELATDWMCLDCELMPWSAKAQELLRTQYAAVGAASRAALRESVSVLERAVARGADLGSLRNRTRDRAELAEKYVESYRRYCWPVRSIEDLRIAPFHLLASEGKVHVDRSNSWHMETLAKLCRTGDSVLMATSHQVVDVTDTASEAHGVRWWEELTARGKEGMVVKPFEFVARGRRGTAQPAVKCRGPEYLRIIYGMEYTPSRSRVLRGPTLMRPFSASRIFQMR